MKTAAATSYSSLNTGKVKSCSDCGRDPLTSKENNYYNREQNPMIILGKIETSRVARK